MRRRRSRNRMSRNRILGILIVVAVGGGAATGFGLAATDDSGAPAASVTPPPSPSAPSAPSSPGTSPLPAASSLLPIVSDPGSSAPTVWPNATNTGVPASLVGSLTKQGRLVVKTNGAHYTHLDITDCVDVEASNVVITQSIIHCSRGAAAVRVLPPATNLLLDQVEISGGGHSSACVSFESFTVERSNLHDCVDGIDFSSNVTVSGDYIHDLSRGRSTHNDSLQTLGGSNDVIKDNTLQAYRVSTRDPMNSAIQTGHLNEALSHVLVADNYMDGGNYTVNAGSTSTDGYPIKDYVFTGNVFGRDFRYGPVQAVGAGTTFDASNVWADNGQPVRPSSGTN
jgi:hypothetical protein